MHANNCDEQFNNNNDYLTFLQNIEENSFVDACFWSNLSNKIIFHYR